MVDKHYAKVTPMTLDQGVAALNRAGSIRGGAPFYADPRPLRPIPMVDGKNSEVA
jgi:hypothetical protein